MYRVITTTRALGPLNKGAPVHPTANTTLDRLNQLAALTGVILPDLGRNTSNAPAKSDLLSFRY
jgi:hypothetical protein